MVDCRSPEVSSAIDLQLVISFIGVVDNSCHSPFRKNLRRKYSLDNSERRSS